VHNINTRNKHPFHLPVTTLSCFLKVASYSGIKMFNSLPRSIRSLKNEKTQFKIALNKFCMFTPFNLWMNFSHVQIIYIADLYDCCKCILYNIIFIYLYVLWHVPQPIVLWQSQGSMECIFIVLHCITYVSGKPIRPFLKGQAVKEQVQKHLRSHFF